MVDGWYTLRALAREWHEELAESTLTDVHSAARDELSLVLERDGESHTLRVSVSPAERFMFRQPGGSRPRRNVTTLFDNVLHRTLRSISVAHRDRVMDLDLADGYVIRILLFGPRANVILARHGIVEASFREKLAEPGAALVEPSPAPEVDDLETLKRRWPAESQPLVRAVARSFPLFGALLAEEVVIRAELPVSDACLVDPPLLERILAAAAGVRADLEAPRSHVYRDGRRPVAFSLLPLAAPPAPDIESFDRVDEAVRAFIRARLSQAAFDREYDPLRRTLEAAAVRNRTRAERMLQDLTGASRADKYERWGHLLMAARPDTQGREQVAVPDLFEQEATAEIPVDPSRSAVENAERYYEKARQTRRAREEAELRLGAVDRARQDAEALLAKLDRIEDRRTLRSFRADHADLLARFSRDRPSDAAPMPFRRFVLGSGYEAWVGRSARENDELTFSHARKHDRWLHARGVAGSHVVLRCPRRAEKPPARVVETAAAIAAWFSKASGSALVPVIVAERRFVRKPRGAAAGAVLVDREEVVIVEPALPNRDGPGDL